MNVVCLTGRLTRDPDIRLSQNSTVANFSIAINRTYKSKETNGYDVDYFNITTFGKTAEFVEKYFTKGMKVEISGELRQNRWTDRDGNKRYDVVVVGNQVSFAESKKASEENGVRANAAPERENKPVPPPSPADDDFFEGADDITEDLPF